MSRTEEKLRFIDYTKNFEKLANNKCNGCENNQVPSPIPYQLSAAISTVGFTPSGRNNNYQNVDAENTLLRGTVNREHKEIVESEMPRRNNIENFGSINSNEFEGSNAPIGAPGSFYDGSNDVLRGIMQEYDREKDKGEFYTFKSTPRRLNIDLSAYMSPPEKILGRGFGNMDVYEKIYLGDQTRSNDYRPIVKDAERIPDVPYYLTALPVFKNLGGDDTRYVNSKLR